MAELSSRAAASLPQLQKAVLIGGVSRGGGPVAAYQRPMIGPALSCVRLFDLLRRQKITTGFTSSSSSSRALSAPACRLPRARSSLMNVVTTGKIPAGEALVLDTSCVLLDREEPTVLISTEDRDNFVKNVVTILARSATGACGARRGRRAKAGFD